METIDLATALPGDLIFCRGSGIVSRAIRLAERIRWRAGSKWNHVAVLEAKSLAGWTVVQAGGRGVTSTPLSAMAPGGGYVVVPAPETCREDVVAFARAQVGSQYGYLTIASIVVTLLSPNFVNVMLPNTWICSALAAESLRAGGWVHNWPDVYQVSPAALSEAL